MFKVPRKRENESADCSLYWVVVSLVAMSFLFGFGAATLVFRILSHGRSDTVLPALILSFAGVVVQFGILRSGIRRLEQEVE